MMILQTHLMTFAMYKISSFVSITVFCTPLAIIMKFLNVTREHYIISLTVSVEASLTLPDTSMYNFYFFKLVFCVATNKLELKLSWSLRVQSTDS